MEMVALIILIAMIAFVIWLVSEEKQGTNSQSNVPAKRKVPVKNNITINENKVNTYKQVNEIKKGTIIEMGKYPYSQNGEKKILSWIVLDIVPNKGALVVCSKCIDSLPFNKIDTAVNWQTSTLRNWLNSDFYSQTFSTEEKKQITLACVDNSNFDPRSTQYSRASSYGSTHDHVFLLSLAEYRHYLGGSSTKIRATPFAKKRGVYCLNSDDCGWWLRTPADACLLFPDDEGWWGRDADYKSNKTAFVFCGEYSRSDGNYVDCPDYGVCPAMWLSAENLETYASRTQSPVKVGFELALTTEQIREIRNSFKEI